MCVAPSSYHKMADSLKCLRKVQHQGHSPSIPSILCFCYFHQHFPHCALSSSISTIHGVPIDSILLLLLRHFWCSQAFPATNQRWHECNRLLTRIVPRNQEEHRCAGCVAAICHCGPPYPGPRKISHLVSFVKVQKNFWVEILTSHSCFLPCTISMPSRQRFLQNKLHKCSRTSKRHLDHSSPAGSTCNCRDSLQASGISCSCVSSTSVLPSCSRAASAISSSMSSSC